MEFTKIQRIKKMIRQELFFPKILNRSLYMAIISFLLIG